jgi:hypothetical protein
MTSTKTRPVIKSSHKFKKPLTQTRASETNTPKKTGRVFKTNTTRKTNSRPPKLSKSQAKHLKRQLPKFGFHTLGQYLLSERWEKTKERYSRSATPEPGYKKRGLPQKCVVCRDPNVDLHHKSYARLGEERLDDLVPLCRTHHDQLHDEGLNLKDGPKILYKRELELRRERDTRPPRLLAAT